MRPIDLLRAVAAGDVTQLTAGIGRTYQHHGQPVTYMDLHSLKRRGWILVPLGGPPTITPDGEKYLRESA